MYRPTSTTSSSLAANCQSVGTSQTPAQKDSFKTSNPQIFPSLNPMGALYQQRKVVHPNPMAQDHSSEPETTKKLKLNVGAEAKINKSSVCDAKAENLDKDGFRMPKLPARLANQTRSQASVETVYNRSFTKAPEKPSFRSRQIRNSNSIKTAKTGGQIKRDPFQGMELSYEQLDPVVFNMMVERLKMELMFYQFAQNQQMSLNGNGMVPFNLSSAIRC